MTNGYQLPEIKVMSFIGAAKMIMRLPGNRWLIFGSGLALNAAVG